QSSRRAAIFLERDVGARELQPLERERHGGIALRAERAHADDAALEVGRGKHAGGREEREADHVAHRSDETQVAAGTIGLHHRGKSDAHKVELAGLQFLRAAAAATRVDELDGKPIGGEEAASLRHPERQHSVHRIRHPDPERGERLGDRRLGGGGEGGRRAERKQQSDDGPTRSGATFGHVNVLSTTFRRAGRAQVEGQQDPVNTKDSQGYTAFKPKQRSSSATVLPLIARQTTLCSILRLAATRSLKAASQKWPHRRNGHREELMKALSIAGTVLASLLTATVLTPVGAADMTHERALNAGREPHNWLLHYNNYQGHRFSQLKEINLDTVKNLKPVFSV